MEAFDGRVFSGIFERVKLKEKLSKTEKIAFVVKEEKWRRSGGRRANVKTSR